MVSLKTESYYLWRDLFFNDFYGNQFKQEDDGVLYYGPNRGYVTSDGTVERFLSGPWKDHLDSMRAELAALKQALPPRYPFAHTIKDAAQPKIERVRIGGARENLGEAVPHHFLSILSDGEPHAFEKGSGRLQLAEAIADARISASPMSVAMSFATCLRDRDRLDSDLLMSWKMEARVPQCHFSFQNRRSSAEIQWGGPPGPRGSPWTRSSFATSLLRNARPARGRPRTSGPPQLE